MATGDGVKLFENASRGRKSSWKRGKKKLRDPETETGSLSNHGQRFSRKLIIDGIDRRFSCFTYGLENGDFRQVHEGKMAKRLEALGSKMATTFCKLYIIFLIFTMHVYLYSR